ncbi:MAG: ABC transporter permease [Flavobacteriaceae bacterium]|nr:ABC transporter permease [Flavobacteriaceae bacterium]
MSKSFDRYNKKRVTTSYLSVVICISLVLFLVGFFSLLILKYDSFSNKIKEKTTVYLFLKDSLTSSNIDAFSLLLDDKKYILSKEYISKKQASEIYSKELGQDFVSFLGENPLKDGFKLKIKAEYVNNESLKEIEKEMLNNNHVLDVQYDTMLVDLLNSKLEQVSSWMLVAGLFFAVLAMLLINSSIRLSVYSKRFIIKTMQMVGATKSYIRKPFIKHHIKLGVFGAIVAFLLLLITIYYIDMNIIGEKYFITDFELLAKIFAITLGLGIVISWASTYFATIRFLNLQTEELH